MTVNVLIVGAGAIGGFYGALLAKAVMVVCRSNYGSAKHVMLFTIKNIIRRIGNPFLAAHVI